MNIRVNGIERAVRDGLTVRRLLDELNLPADRVAVERNREIVRRADWESVTVGEGDSFEIVSFVGGG